MIRRGRQGNAVPADWIREDAQDITRSARMELVGRPLIGVMGRLLGRGVGTYRTFQVGEIANVLVQYGYARLGENLLETKPHEWKLPKIQTIVKIPREDLEAYEFQGIPYSTVVYDEAGRAIQEQEDALITVGGTTDGTNYEWPGMFKMAGTVDSTGYDFATAGQAIVAVRAAKAGMKTLKANGPYNIVLNYESAGQLEASILGSGAGIDEWRKVLDMLGVGGGIWESSALATTEGYMSVLPGKGWFIYVLATDLHIEPRGGSNASWYNADGDLVARASLDGAPIFPRLNAAGTCDAIYAFSAL